MSMNFPMDSSVQHQYYVVPTASFPPYQHQQQHQHQQHPSHHHHHNTHQQHAQGSQMVPPYGVHPSGSHFGAPPTGLHQPTTIYELPPSLTGNYQVHPVPLALLSPPMGPSMPPQSYLPAPTYHAPSYAQDIVYQSSSQGVTPHHQHHHNQPPPPHYHLPPNMTTTASTIHLGRPSGPLLPANSAGVCEVPSLPVINHTPPQHPALVDKALEPTPADMPPPVRALSFASCRQQRSMKRLEIPPPLPGDTEGPRQLIVNYLSLDIGSAELYDLFTPYGEVEMARVATDTATGRSIGYGFVFMKRYLDAMQAVEHASGRVLLGKRVRVSFAVPQRPVHEATHRHGAVFGPSSISNATKMEALPRQ